MIRQSLHRIKTNTVKASQCDWFSFAKSGIRTHYTVTVRTTFYSLQETDKRHTKNGECKNFVTTNIEVASKLIPDKPKAKCWVLCVSMVIGQKLGNMKKN